MKSKLVHIADAHWKLLLLLLAIIPVVGYFTYIQVWGDTFINTTITTNPNLENGLVGHWTLDGADIDLSQTTAEIRDRSGNGNHGNWNNHASTTIPGKLGQAIEFDGVDDDIDVGKDSSLDMGSGDFTISSWFKTTQNSGSGIIASKGSCGSGGKRYNLWGYRSAEGDVVALSIDDDTSLKRVDGATVVNDGKWHLATGVRDGNNLRIYLDGVEDSAAVDITGYGSLDDTDRNLLLGRQYCPGSTNEFLGSLDDTRLYNRALSQDEITRLYQLGATTHVNTSVTSNGILDNNLVAHWTFDGNDVSGAITYDKSGNGNHGNTCPGGYSSIVSALSPEANWNFTDDGNDDSGNGNNVTSTVGSPSFSSTIIPCAPYANALFLNADEGYVYANSTEINTYTNPAGDHWAASLWINATAVASGEGNVIYEEGGGTNSLSMYTYDNGGTDEVYCTMVESAAYDFVSYAIDLNTTYHVGCIWDVGGGSLTMYINGQLVDTDSSLAVGSDLASHSGDISIGGAGGSPDNHLGNPITGIFEGYIADMALWGVNDDGAVSGSDFLDIYNAGNGSTITQSLGHIGQAFDFDGSDDYLDVGSDTSLDVSDEITIAVWVKTTDTAGYIYAKRNDTVGAVSLFLNSEDQKQELWVGVTQAGATSNTAFSDGQWHHLVATFKDSTNAVQYYIDGAADGTSSNAGSIDNSVSATIGERVSGGGVDTFFDGEIDDMRVYNRVLSQNEITRLYQLSKAARLNKTIEAINPLQNGLVGHWTFDGTDVDLSSSTAEILDASGNNKRGNWINHASTTFPGKIGQAIDFDGSDDYIQIDNPSLPTGDFTYALWVNLDTNNDEDLLMASNNGTDFLVNEIDLYVDPTFAIQVDVGDDAVSTAQVPTGEWTHLVATRIGSDIQLYINANPDGTGSDGATLDFSTCPLLIGLDADTGCTGSLGNYTNGKIDDVRVYNRGLSQEEVTRLYQLGR